MRPNLFANTPDILHEYLQTGGRPAFQMRLVLAATLGASYGIYGPAFELRRERRCAPGSEEYLDSEKYQIRRGTRTAGQPRDFIARVNAIRRENPALQSNCDLRFHAIDNDQMIAYSKGTPDGSDLLLVVVNLDPYNMQHGFVSCRWTTGATPYRQTIDAAICCRASATYWRGEGTTSAWIRSTGGAHPGRLRW